MNIFLLLQVLFLGFFGMVYAKQLELIQTPEGAFFVEVPASAQIWSTPCDLESFPIGEETFEANTIFSRQNKQMIDGTCGTVFNLLDTSVKSLVEKPVYELETEVVQNQGADGSTSSLSPELRYKLIKHERKGVMEIVTAQVGKMYASPPVEPFSIQATNYVNTIQTELNPIQTVNAQDAEQFVYYPGLGFNILQPIQNFWSINRNVAYGFLVIIVIIDAFLILLRRQNGGDLLTIVNTLPSILLSLILITFSYAISGLFIDIITVGTNFTQFALVSSPGSPGYNTIWNSNRQLQFDGFNFTTILRNPEGDVQVIDDFVEDFTTDNLGNINIEDNGSVPLRTAIQADDPLISVWLVFGTADLSIVRDDISTLGGNILPDANVIQASSPVSGGINAITGLIQGIESNANSVSLSGVSSKIITLILAITMLRATFGIFFKLIRAYLTLLLYPIISPYIFLIAALPTQTNAMIGNFVNTMLSSALKFVVTYAVFLLIVVFSYDNTVQSITFLPPLLGYDQNDIVASNGTLVKTLVGYGLFLSVPLILDQVDKFLSAAGDSAFGENIQKQTASNAAGLYNLVAGAITRGRKSAIPDGR